MDVELVTNDHERRRFLDWLDSVDAHRMSYSPWRVVDTETTGLDPWHDELRLVQFGDTRKAWVLPFPEERALVDAALRFPRVLTGHNSKFDYQFLSVAGELTPLNFFHDTKIMLHLLDSASSMSLKDAAVRYLGEDMDQAQRELKEVMRRNRWTWATIPKDEPVYWVYAGLDTILAARIAERLYPSIQGKYADLYQTETQVWWQMVEAEQAGLRIDRDYVERQAASLREEIAAIVAKWPDINLDSGKQVGEALEAKGFQLPRTPTGKPMTAVEILSEVPDVLALDVLAYRKAKKLLETYFQNFLDLEVDGYVHPTINTIGPRTGRMSCENPNLQNVPRGSFVRPSFIASEGCTLVLADYSQIEYRLFAHYAQEPRMIQAFRDGRDMHAETARIILGREPNEEERTTAKTANFSMLFGAGTSKFAATAGIPYDEAKDFMETYNREFPQVQKFVMAMLQYTRGNGMAIETAYGRRCSVDQDHLYAGTNYMIQGTAADVLKRAIVNVSETKWGEFFRLPVHDELIFDVPVELAPSLMAELPELMEVRDRFDVPLTVEVKSQRRWGVSDEEERRG